MELLVYYVVRIRHSVPKMVAFFILCACIEFASGKIAVFHIRNTFKSEVLSSKFVMPKTLCDHYLPNGRM
jgi:hypothetical protein